MRFGVVADVTRAEAVKLAQQIHKMLVAKGIKVTFEEHLAAELKLHGVALSAMDVDVLLTIGGDGTLLKALQSVSSRVEVLGINTGLLGFLTELWPTEVEGGLERVLRGAYFVEERARIKTLLNGTRLVDSVNEAVVHTAQIAKMQRFKIFIDGIEVQSVNADGIIVATPTGSTGYALSVGGPLLDPRVAALLIIPIAPFKLSARPLVVPQSCEIEIKVATSAGKLESEENPILLVLDGQYVREVSERDMLKFTVSEEPARLIKFESDFYKKLAEKLEW
jgi:NAD+ kinase